MAKEHLKEGAERIKPQSPTAKTLRVAGTTLMIVSGVPLLNHDAEFGDWNSLFNAYELNPSGADTNGDGKPDGADTVGDRITGGPSRLIRSSGSGTNEGKRSGNA